jgi:exodeoxyribonuclease VII small subunit
MSSSASPMMRSARESTRSRSEMEATSTPENYETAVARLEQIIARLDSGEAELRETLELCVEAKGLIEFCKTELDAVSGQLKELKLDELVGELERPAGDADA